MTSAPEGTAMPRDAESLFDVRTLRARIRQLESGYDELRTVNNRLQRRAEAAERRAGEMEKDTERFVWYFSDSEKGLFINEYLRGVREGWSVDQWRDAIDAAMSKSDA